jgi:hypothetical protein
MKELSKKREQPIKGRLEYKETLQDYGPTPMGPSG